MNEPYQRVHSQDQSNSTLYRNIAVDVGAGLAITGAIDGLGIYRNKKATTPEQKELVYQQHYADSNVKAVSQNLNELTQASFGRNLVPEKAFDGKIGSKVGKIPVFNASSKWGRITGYGGSILGGALTGSLRTTDE